VKRLFLISLLWGLCIQSHADTLTGRVVRVTDGDTIVVLDADETQHKIRLTGIDAPERGQAYGTKSKEHLSESVAGEVVVVEYDKYDRYGRVLGKVLLDGEDVNLEQIWAGLAWHYKKYQGEQTVTDGVAYSDAEMEARRRKLGLWSDPAAMPPWDYRKAQRDRKKAMEAFTIKSETLGEPYKTSIKSNATQPLICLIKEPIHKFVVFPQDNTDIHDWHTGTPSASMLSSFSRLSPACISQSLITILWYRFIC
jgi:endonuclease YncB( thermonuclease family)